MYQNSNNQNTIGGPEHQEPELIQIDLSLDDGDGQSEMGNNNDLRDFSHEEQKQQHAKADAKAHKIEHDSDDDDNDRTRGGLGQGSENKMVSDPQSNDPQSIGIKKNIKLHDIKVDFNQNGDISLRNPIKSEQQPKENDLGVSGIQFEKKSNCEKFALLIKWIGAILSLLNMSADILYAYKSPYANSLIFQLTCGILVLRLLIVFGLGQYYYTTYVRNWKPNMAGMSEEKCKEEDSDEQVEDQAKAESLRFTEIRKQGQDLYTSIHFLLYTGFFRVLPLKDFIYIVSFGYASEWILSFIPMFFLQMFNNSETLGDLNIIQSLAVQLKVIILLVLVLELIILISEVRHIKQMRKLKIQAFEKITEMNRRRKYNRVMSILSVIAMFAMIVLIIVGSVIGKGRECVDKQTLQNAVCVDCIQESCLECSQGSPNSCNTCDVGFLLNQENKCEDCDDLEFKKCIKCKFASDSKTKICEKCTQGFRLEGGKCIPCSQSQYCAECSEDKCLKCKEGSRFQNGECLPCSKDLTHCVQCEQQDVCSKCDYHVANLDDLGKCSKCRTENNWIKNDNTGECQCFDFVNVLNGNKCQTCDEILPGCQTCEQTDKPGNALKQKIGFDSDLSPRQGEYVVCKSCGSNMIFDSVTNQCQYCNKKFTNCYSCSKDGNSCEYCRQGSMKIQSQRNGTKCIACSYWGPACQKCNSRGCSVCKRGFNNVLGFCFRAWF